MSLYKGNNLISGAMPNSANQSLSNLDSAGQDKFDEKVNKSGDTMTGNLTILKDSASYVTLKSSFDSTTTTAPSGYTGLGTFQMYDTNGKITGFIENSINTRNLMSISIGSRRIINGENKTASLGLMVDASGNASCTFPNTKCVDGQWTALNQIIINTSTSLNGSTNLPYTVNVPTDGYTYEVLLYGEIETGTTTGSWAASKIDGAYASTVSIGRARTRTASSVMASGSGTILVDSSRKIYLERDTGWNGTCTFLKACSYRRMGSNA
jgi:hypothetical protein